jgi:plastocyanin
MRKGRTRPRAGVHAATAAIAIAAGLGVVGVAGARSAADDYTVAAVAADNVWHPPEHTIQPGDKVTWTFESGSTHNVQSVGSNWSFTSGPPPSQDPASYTFTSAGDFNFVCTVHPGMNGTIHVEGDPPPPPPPPAATATPTPTPPPQSGGGMVTPAPSASTDTVKPSVRSVRLTARRRAVRVRFSLSEPATVTLTVKRRGSRKVLKSARVQARAGTRTVTLRSARLKKGRYAVQIRARDAAGNRSASTTKKLAIRR